MHQDFSASDVPEGKERIERDILKTLQTMTSDTEHRDGTVCRSAARPHIIRMGPISHIVEVMIAAAGIIGFVLAQERRSRSSSIRVTGSIRRMDGVVSTNTVKPVTAVGIILKSGGNICILGRFSICDKYDKCFTARDLGRR